MSHSLTCGCDPDHYTVCSLHAQPSPAGEGAQETLLEKAVADRDARPWRYYRLDHDTMKRFCEQLADERDRLRAALALSPERAALVERLERLRMRVEGERRTMLSSPMGLSQLYSAIEKGLREAVSVLKGE